MVSQTLVAPPVRRPRLGGISKVASFVSEPRLAGLAQAQYLSDGCSFPQLTLGLCFGQQPVGTTNEIQQVAITGAPTGGTFTLTLNGFTTAALPWNATAAQVQTALTNLQNVGVGNATAAGGALPGTPVTVTFTGSLQGTNVPQMTSAASLTGGTTPAVAITTPTPGVQVPNASVGVTTRSNIAAPFALYAGVECWLIEGNDYDARAAAILAQGRDRQVEAQIASWALGGTALAGGDIIATIGQVEQHMDTNYLGQGVILLSRQDAVKAFAARAINDDDLNIGVAQTINGTPVLASGMVTPGKVSGLGAITVLQSDVAMTNALNPTLNRDWAVAQQVFDIIVDCDYRTVGTAT